ncbi:hypothetical protein BP5796_03537 [Coleophoma crateriformis]|uniref:Tat pathway signal sequence n=1 Tax=Coleophoma crateriformis TaxID=565419 RepID=A0A3D8SND6_9HELO|nr:hypothetical protein BP5796_03537 [Coleophoma crateriformis]
MARGHPDLVLHIFDTKYLAHTDGLSRARTVIRELYAPSAYNSPNETEAAAAWDTIRVGHGIVALDEQYIAENHLPKSFAHPYHPTKHAYVIEAYHAIHCITILRQHYQALDQGKPWDWPRGHDLHCFNVLCEYIMCNIDDTPLNFTHDRDSGHRLKKKCQDWDALSHWAGEHSSGYHFHEPNGSLRGPWLEDYTPGDGLVW